MSFEEARYEALSRQLGSSDPSASGLARSRCDVTAHLAVGKYTDGSCFGVSSLSLLGRS